MFGSRLEVSPRGPPATEADRTRERLRRSLGSARSRRSASLDPARPRQIRSRRSRRRSRRRSTARRRRAFRPLQSPRSPRSLSALTRRSARPKAGSDARRSAEPRTRLPERERSDRRSQRFPPRYPRSVPPGRRLRWRRSEPYLPRSHPFRCFRRRSRFRPSDGTSGSDPFAVTARQTASVGVGERHCRGHAMTIRRIRRGLAEAVVDDSELGDELLAGLRFPVGRERVGAVGDHVESSLVDVDGRVARCLTERVARGQSVVASCRSNAELEPVEPVEIVTRFDRGVPRRGQPSEPRRVHRVDHGVVRSDPFRLRERVALDGVSHRRCAPRSTESPLSRRRW